MPLKFHPRAGEVLVCKFDGFTVPEMVKPRPVVVISPRLPNRSGLVTVVPLSTTAPNHTYPYVFRLSKNYHPAGPIDLPTWAKADMLLNLSLTRLDGFKVGRRQWVIPRMEQEDLDGVRLAVLHGLGFGALIKPQ